MKNDYSFKTAHENRILDLLPAEAYERIRPHLEEVRLPIGQNLFEDGDVIKYVYFPLDAIIPLFLTMQNGATIETAIIGSEGVINFLVFMGANIASGQATVLHSNRALRIKSEIIKKEFDRGGQFRNRILLYMNAFYAQLSQMAACNRNHHIEKRLCRWLLQIYDRLKVDELKVTQDFVARMLSIQRPYITAAIGILQKKGVIRWKRGSVEILDRKRMEDSACECYEIIRQEFHFYDKNNSLFNVPAKSVRQNYADNMRRQIAAVE